ncbi:MAG: hypothetical protein HOP14_13430 [Acidobacteria bacterium]|nr:hypothetical protein [Acidobacteriota bacterium]
MVDQIRVVTVTVPSGSTLVDFTHPEITEAFSAAIFIYSAFTTDDTDNAHGVLGIGFVAPDPGAGTEEQGMCSHAQSGQNTTPNCGVRHSIANAAITVGDPASANAATPIAVAAYSASIAGGVRMNFTTSAIDLKVTAILFAGLARAYTDDCSSTSAGVHESVGGTTDFEPDLVVFAATSNALNTNQADAIPNIGFALNKAGIPQVCAVVNADDATEPSDADGYTRTDAAFTAFLGGIRTTPEHSVVTSFDSTGFNHTSNAGSPAAHYLALKFSGAVRMACAHLAAPGSTGVAAFNAFGFTPDLVLGMSTLLGSLDTLIDGPTASCSGFFVTGRHGSRSYTWHHEEGLTLGGAVVANANSRQEDVAVLTYEHTGGIAQRATWAGASGGGGFLLDFSVATAGHLTALGIQLAPNPPLMPHGAMRAAPGADRARPRRVWVGGKLKRLSSLFARLAWTTQRWAAFDRVHHRRRVPQTIRPVGLPSDEETKGRALAPGLVRGRTLSVTDGSVGRVLTPGLARGRTTGPGVASPDIEP